MRAIAFLRIFMGSVADPHEDCVSSVLILCIRVGNVSSVVFKSHGIVEDEGSEKGNLKMQPLVGQT